MGASDQMHEAPSIESLDKCNDSDAQRSGCLLVFGHVLITCSLGPAAGAVAWSLVYGNWQILAPVRLLGLFFAMPLFCGPFWLPFCVISWPLCIMLQKSRWRSVLLWSFGGALVGLTIALFWLLFATWPKGPSGEEGAAIGLASGVLLRWLWIPSTSKQRA